MNIPLTHKGDLSARYKSEWGGADYVHMYGLDLDKREIYLFGRDEYAYGCGEDEISEPGVEYTMANQFIKNLRILQSLPGNDPILIHMKTNGGDWTEGMAIYQAIKACPNEVVILNYTHARSMSSIIFLAADKRVMFPYSTFMMHKGTQYLGGTITQVYTEIEETKKADKIMIDIYVEALKESERFKGKTDSAITKWLLAQMREKEEVYLNAEEAVELNLADFIFGEDGTYDWAALRKIL